MYTEKLLPPPAIPALKFPNADATPSTTTLATVSTPTISPTNSSTPAQPLGPLGLPSTPFSFTTSTSQTATELPPSDDQSRTVSVSLLDRLAARDRAYGLLNGLTKLGSGWNQSEAWFALARAYEESGQVDRAREVLWWCVELEDAKPVRDWKGVGVEGYVL